MSFLPQLRGMPKQALIALIDDLYGRYGDIDEIIESHLERVNEGWESEPEQQADQLAYLQTQVARLIADNVFIEYHRAQAFCSGFEQLLADICSHADQDAVRALALFDEVLSVHGDLYERVDDSDGYLEDALGTAVELWLAVAAKARLVQPQARDWVAAVCSLYDDNDYGCFDSILSLSGVLLTEDELRQLAGRFENAARAAIVAHAKEGNNLHAADACFSLRGVAEALGDISLYERATLLINPRPDTMQLQELIEYALAINALERAAHWLQQPQWEGEPERCARLNNRLLERQGNITQLKQNLLADFQQAPGIQKLQTYWVHADSNERKAITEQVLTHVTTLNSAGCAIEQLMFVGAAGRAADYLIEHHAGLVRLSYLTLLRWVEYFEGAGQTLAAIVCYRLLLNDLLERGYSKAYHHGARYFQTLLALDVGRPDYRELDDAQAFITTLQAKHWRKRSFWEAAGHPNKPAPKPRQLMSPNPAIRSSC